MNHSEGRGSSGRKGSRGRFPASDMVYRRKSNSPVTADRSLDESSGERVRGSSRGRGRSTKSWVPRDTSGRGSDEHSPVQAYDDKSNVRCVGKRVQHDRKSQEDIIGSTEQPDDGASLKLYRDNMDLLQSSTSSCSKSINLSGSSFEDKDVAMMRCDLVNRIEDVSLPCQESVSSTSVEDHNSASNSGAAGNSSSESSTKPFDLCLKKKGIVLKPSQLELNRANRNATKGYTGSVIRPGMVLLKNFLSINDQVMVVNKCRELGFGEGGFYQPGYRDGALLHLKMMCLGKNWDPETSRYGEIRPVDGSIPPIIPVEFSQFVEKAIKESQSLAASNSKETKGEDGIPSMSPDICIVNFYTSTGRLGLHQDKDESEKSIRKGLPVVSFSIGDSAEFLYGDQRDNDKTDMVVLESGDVLLFGGKSRNVFHGVRSILKDTAPKVLIQETSLRPGRLNLTFRQY